MAFPVAGALSVILIIGVFALATGSLMIALAFKLRSLRRPGGEIPHVPPRRVTEMKIQFAEMKIC